MIYRFLFITLCVTAVPLISAADPLALLEKCWIKQVKSLGGKYLALSYQEVTNRLYHSFEPWQVYSTKSCGVVYVNGKTFYKIDSIVTPKATLVGKTQWSSSELLYLDHGDTSLTDVTRSDHLDELLETARLSPIPLIDYFYSHRDDLRAELTNDFAIYTLTINKTVVTLAIHKADDLLRTVTLVRHHELYGDAESTYRYDSYMTGLNAPKNITIEKVNNRVRDELTIRDLKVLTDTPPLLIRPSNFAWKDESSDIPEFSVSKYNDHIHFIDLKHTDSKVMVVEYKDFLLVAEAPLNSENGELIIREARKLAPTKPIRYFTFGHHHPHYIGGIRPFIHKGATILTIPGVADYLNVIASAKRTLKPDSLFLNPAPLLLQQFTDSTTITDGTHEMKIFLLGKKSEHAFDFLVYYFPKEKMLFQGELVWIDKDKPLAKAGKRQAGLYNFIKELKIDVANIVQSWPLAKYNVQSNIPFVELERSMSVQ